LTSARGENLQSYGSHTPEYQNESGDCYSALLSVKLRGVISLAVIIT